jgi:hypothetical protein
MIGGQRKPPCSSRLASRHRPQLHPIGRLRPEDKDRAREWIGTQMLLHHRRQSVHAFAEIDRLGRDQHSHSVRQRDHVDRNADITTRSALPSIRPCTITRTPLGKAISMLPGWRSTPPCIGADVMALAVQHGPGAVDGGHPDHGLRGNEGRGRRYHQLHRLHLHRQQRWTGLREPALGSSRK